MTKTNKNFHLKTMTNTVATKISTAAYFPGYWKLTFGWVDGLVCTTNLKRQYSTCYNLCL